MHNGTTQENVTTDQPGRQVSRPRREILATLPAPPDREHTPDEQQQAGEGPLLPPNFTQELRSRWDRIQAGFVDEPKAAVQQADERVSTAIKKLADAFGRGPQRPGDTKGSRRRCLLRGPADCAAEMPHLFSTASRRIRRSCVELKSADDQSDRLRHGTLVK
jgi:hypothetical protein